MRIGIFGGSFNPPHIGHVRAAESAIEQLGLELLIVVPTGMPPHKTLPPGSPSANQRLHMAQAAFKNTRNVSVSDFEAKNAEPAYTIDTVRSIKGDYPGAELYLLVGADMYLTLDQWKNSGELLEAITPVTFSRCEADREKIDEYTARLSGRCGANIKTLENEFIDISSSRLREMLPLRQGAKFLADENYSYIISNRLYNAKPDWDWLRERAYSMLDPARIPHVAACEDAAVSLAGFWGADADDAREAAILHDITKRLNTDEHFDILNRHAVEIGELGFGEEKLLHSITGAVIAGSEFGSSKAVTEAIKWHTTGRAHMTTLEKVLYLADYIEATRELDGIADLRRKAYEDIDEAVMIGLEMSIEDLLSRGITPNSTSSEALDDLLKVLRARNQGR